MATCGPANAQQQLKSHVLRDASLQRENAFASRGPDHSFRSARPDQSAAAFAKFNRAAPPPESPVLFDFAPAQLPSKYGPARPLADEASPAASYVGYPGPRGTLATNGPRLGTADAEAERQAGDWTSEFQRLSLNDPFQHSLPRATPDTMYGRPQFVAGRMPASAFVGSTGEALSFPQYAPAVEANAAFEAAFLDVEQSLKKLTGQPPAPQAEPQRQDRQQDGHSGEHARAASQEAAAAGQSRREHDASSVAETIMRQVSDHSSPDLLDKMKNSQFMAVMNKLRTKEVRLDADESTLVDSHGSVDAYDVSPDSTHDWPPQRQPAEPLRHASPHAAREQPPLARSEFATPPAETARDDHRGELANGLPILDDPDTYLRKIQKNLDPRLFQRSPYTSPFSEAARLGPLPLRTRDWEENYEDWV